MCFVFRCLAWKNCQIMHNSFLSIKIEYLFQNKSDKLADVSFVRYFGLPKFHFA